jgi:carbonic anhydrase
MGDDDNGLIDNWLMHIKDVSRLNEDELQKTPHDCQFDRLCELNVIEQVENVRNTTVVRSAWNKGQNLTVHGWIYDIKNGILKDLETSLDCDSRTK